MKINKFRELVDQMTEAESEMEFTTYENQFICLLMGSVLIGASLVTLLLGILWGYPFFIALLFTIFLGTCGILVLLIPKATSISLNARIHLTNIIVTFAALVTYFVYSKELGIQFSFVIIIIIFISSASLNSLSRRYSIVLSVVFLIVVSITLHGHVYTFDLSTNLILIFMLLFINILALCINQLYAYTTQKKRLRYEELLQQNEEITGLYEEIVATEETLKDQNAQLKTYNSEILEHQKRLHFLSYSDPLTGLSNRKRMMEELHTLTDLTIPNQKDFSLFYIDIDNFKRINDSLGHIAGDVLLCQLSERLRGFIHRSDMLGRLGGDELALIIRRHLSDELLYAYAEEIRLLFEEPFTLNQKSIKISVSIGIALWPTDAKDGEELLKAADTAMFKAKDLGRNFIQFFQQSMKNDVLKKIEMENQLIQAFKSKEFYLEYQPICSPAGSPLGFEALIRWNNPSLGRVSPMDFIPLIEELGLIDDIGKWILMTACHKINALNADRKNPYFMSVNISPTQIKHSNFVDSMMTIIEACGTDPTWLQFEITETVFIDNMGKASNILRQISQTGILIALDDFGTGYSSLSYLLDLPINTMKIDKTFVDGIISNKNRPNIIGDIIKMAHNMDMHVVAEGVEEREQLNYLTDKKCDMIQGYYFSKPLGDSDLDSYLSK